MYINVLVVGKLCMEYDKKNTAIKPPSQQADQAYNSSVTFQFFECDAFFIRVYYRFILQYIHAKLINMYLFRIYSYIKMCVNACE